MTNEFVKEQRYTNIMLEHLLKNSLNITVSKPPLPTNATMNELKQELQYNNSMLEVFIEQILGKDKIPKKS